jgi:glycogen debranching enzyme
VGESFRKAFTGGPAGGLHDCLRPDPSGKLVPTGELRPNQIFAVSLDHSPLTPEQQRAVVTCVRDHLLTPLGLRTLAASDPKYCPRFTGDMMKRDAAYHNGTVWPWLIGAYAEAVLRVGGFSTESKSEARSAIQPLIAAMAGAASGAPGAGCVGQIAEIFDADEPRTPQGCIAQAWSIAEPLRVVGMLG